MARAARQPRDIGRLPTRFLLLVLVVAAAFLLGPVHGLMHHEGHSAPADDCQLCHVHCDTFEVVDLVAACQGSRDSVPPGPSCGLVARILDWATAPRGPPAG